MKILQHKFVEFIPEILEDDTLYISTEYGIVVHKCCCGCGNRIVTPLSPTDWKLIFDGESVSLYPSIGNWVLKCRSHYWIENNQVYWAEQWSDNKVKAEREREYLNKRNYYSKKSKQFNNSTNQIKSKTNFWTKLKNLFY
ncbi:MAG TPA: DUF6527 family protein [Ignavibacteria bacterium]|jgi:hypothetical protein